MVNYLRIREDAFSKKVILGGYSQTGVYPMNENIALEAYKTFGNRQPLVIEVEDPIEIMVTKEKSPEITIIESTNKDNIKEEEDKKIFNPIDPWRSVRMHFVGKLKNQDLEKIRTMYQNQKGALSREAALQERVDRLENELATLKRPKTKTRITQPSTNENVVRLLKSVDKLEDHPLPCAHPALVEKPPKNDQENQANS